MAVHKNIDIDLFISHASEDKATLVRPLARYLRKLGARVWYDEFSLSIGDSLSRSLDKGLAIAKYGLVVISPHFIEKDWTEYELRGLTAREVGSGENIILPIWHGIKKSEIVNYSPTLADKIAIDTRDKTIEELAEAVIKVIRPDLSARASLLRYLVRDRSNEKPPLWVPIEEIGIAPAPEEFVMEGHFIIRALNVVSILQDAPSKLIGNFSEFLINLARDSDPEIELRIWEAIAAVYSYANQRFRLSPTEKDSIVDLTLYCSFDGQLDARREHGAGLDPTIVDTVIGRWDYLAELRHSGHVRFVTRLVNEDASGAEIIDNGNETN